MWVDPSRAGFARLLKGLFNTEDHGEPLRATEKEEDRRRYLIGNISMFDATFRQPERLQSRENGIMRRVR